MDASVHYFTHDMLQLGLAHTPQMEGGLLLEFGVYYGALRLALWSPPPPVAH